MVTGRRIVCISFADEVIVALDEMRKVNLGCSRTRLINEILAEYLGLAKPYPAKIGKMGYVDLVKKSEVIEADRKKMKVEIKKTIDELNTGATEPDKDLLF
jgi:metal-responsive CopG/Arc/MetJ family transcriptional regulator